MEAKIKEVLKYLLNNPISSQRAISKDLNYSLGSINHILKTLIQDDFVTVKDHSYRKKEYIVSSKAINKYIKNSNSLSAIILCAGNSEVYNTPTPLLKLDDKTILERQILDLKRCGIDSITVVIGKDNPGYSSLEKKYDLKIIQNEDYIKTGSMYSLSLSKDFINEDVIVLEGDLVYDSNTIETVKNSPFSNCTIVTEPGNNDSKVFVSLDSDKNIHRVSKDINSLISIDGELLGITKLKKELIISIIEKSLKFANNQLYYEYLFEDSKINALYLPDLRWCDVDNYDQYLLAKDIISEIT